MPDKTILVIDVDQETEEKIVSTLEAEDYLVFAASGREITSGMAGKISPALIFLKPTANSVEGFEICKTIHSSEAFKKVPIIVLASLKGPLDVRYTSFYGIVDFLEIPVSPEAIIEKAEKILGSKSHDNAGPVVEDIESIEEENAPVEETPVTQDKDPVGPEFTDEEEIAPAEETPVTQDKDTVDQEYTDKESGQPIEDYSYRGRRRRPKKSGLMVPVLLVTVAVAIVAGGFLIYKLFFSPAEVSVPVKVTALKAVQPKVPPVLPSVAQQPKEQPVAEVKPAETKEVQQQAPKQAPQKASAVVSAAKPVVELYYSVQLGAFKSEVSAEALAKVYKGKGHEAFTHKGTTTDNRTLYRVLIGKFKNRKEALQLADKLQAKEKIKTTVFSEGMK